MADTVKDKDINAVSVKEAKGPKWSMYAEGVAGYPDAQRMEKKYGDEYRNFILSAKMGLPGGTAEFMRKKNEKASPDIMKKPVKGTNTTVTNVKTDFQPNSASPTSIYGSSDKGTDILRMPMNSPFFDTNPTAQAVKKGFHKK